MSFERHSPPPLDSLGQNLLAHTPLHFVCYTGDEQLLDTLIGRTTFYNSGEAATACAAALISEEDAINGWTPAHWAAFYGHLGCLMKLHVCSKLAFDIPSHRSNTSPLHLSAQSGSVQCLKWLLEYGSSTNRQDFLGDTALHKAARAGNTECINILLRHGASVSVKNHRGLTAADLAEQSEHSLVAQHLRQASLAMSSQEEDITDNQDTLPCSNFPESKPSVYAPEPNGVSIPSILGNVHCRRSEVIMNGENIHSDPMSESCDMDLSESGLVARASLDDDWCLDDSVANKKRSREDCDVQKNLMKRHCGSLQNIASKPTFQGMGQSSVSEYEAAVTAQQSYDNSCVRVFSVFH